MGGWGKRKDGCILRDCHSKHHRFCLAFIFIEYSWHDLVYGERGNILDGCGIWKLLNVRIDQRLGIQLSQVWGSKCCWLKVSLPPGVKTNQILPPREDTLLVGCLLSQV